MAYETMISHRGYNLKCKWWSRINNSFDFSKNPNGFFYAKELSDKQLMKDYFMGNNMVFMERDTVVIKTPDDLTGIKVDDAVEFQGEKWFVSTVQRTQARNQQAEFTNHKKIDYYWSLSLRK